VAAPIFYFTRMVPDYRVALLERLSDRLGGGLIVAAGRPPNGSALSASLTKPKYEHVELPNYWMGGDAIHFQPFHTAFRRYGRPRAVLLEESPRSVSLPLLLAYLRAQAIPTVLWGHFSSNTRVFSPSNWGDRYRIWLARQADACLCYADNVAELLRPFVSPQRLFVARNTLDTSVLFALHEELAREGKEPARARLGLRSDEAVILFVGRLTADKGLDALLDVFKRITASRRATLLIIGDGPERVRLTKRVETEKITNVRFLGPLNDWRESAPFVYCSDVMVMPRYLGLAINHAFCFGVPVVSQLGPPGVRFHGPEVDYVRTGENGILAAHDDPDSLHRAVEEVLQNQADFSKSALRYARTCLRADQMLDGIEEALRFVESRYVSRQPLNS
jgi:glycosyltransferase involved in cell wall biosynthesis